MGQLSFLFEKARVYLVQLSVLQDPSTSFLTIDPSNIWDLQHNRAINSGSIVSVRITDSIHFFNACKSLFGNRPVDTGSCALCAYQLMIGYCSVCVDIICVAVERRRKETEIPSEFQSCYHHVEEGQLSFEK